LDFGCGFDLYPTEGAHSDPPDNLGWFFKVLSFNGREGRRSAKKEEGGMVKKREGKERREGSLDHISGYAVDQETD